LSICVFLEISRIGCASGDQYYNALLSVPCLVGHLRWRHYWY